MRILQIDCLIIITNNECWVLAREAINLSWDFSKLILSAFLQYLQKKRKGKLDSISS